VMRKPSVAADSSHILRTGSIVRRAGGLTCLI
jgi:hypothetical protein